VDALLRFLLEFCQDHSSSAPVIFSSCTHISYTHFDTSMVRVGCYGYEI